MKLLTNLNASKAAGPDQLSGRLLKATARESAEILQVIFQRSIDEGVLPEDWKKALITPVYKKASRSNPANQIRRNNRLFKSRKKSQKHRSNFLKNRRNLQKQMRQARWDHINGIITQEGDKARKGFWRYVKQFKKDNTGITVLKKDGRSATSPQQKAEMLNAQCSSVFTEEDTENLPQLNKQYPSLSILSVSAIGVEKLLLNLNASKAAGPDKLSGKLLKATAHEIAPVLQVIFQRSIDEGTLPQAWKEATISPVYKKECRSNPANYRPVSLTCILCKILEHIINRHILDHLDEHRILVDAQHGFRKRRSCETQLILTCHDLAKVVNDSGQVDMLVLDFAKAFDTVAHKRLLGKFESYGIDGNGQPVRMDTVVS